MFKENFIIGVAGDSGVGKTTVANIIFEEFGDDNVTIVSGDDMHRWERGNENWKILTHLNPLANDLNLGLYHLKLLKSRIGIHRRFYDHSNGKFTEYNFVTPKEYVIHDGLHSLYNEDYRNLTDLKIYIRASEPLRRYWKIQRDVDQRGHTKESVLAHCERRSVDFEKYIKPQEDFADLVINFEFKDPIDADYPIRDNPEICLTVFDKKMMI